MYLISRDSLEGVAYTSSAVNDFQSSLTFNYQNVSIVIFIKLNFGDN